MISIHSTFCFIFKASSVLVLVNSKFRWNIILECSIHKYGKNSLYYNLLYFIFLFFFVQYELIQTVISHNQIFWFLRLFLLIRLKIDWSIRFNYPESLIYYLIWWSDINVSAFVCFCLMYWCSIFSFYFFFFFQVKLCFRWTFY